MVRKALNPQPSVSQSVNNQGGHRAARAAKNGTKSMHCIIRGKFVISPCRKSALFWIRAVILLFRAEILPCGLPLLPHSCAEPFLGVVQEYSFLGDIYTSGPWSKVQGQGMGPGSKDQSTGSRVSCSQLQSAAAVSYSQLESAAVSICSASAFSSFWSLFNSSL